MAGYQSVLYTPGLQLIPRKVLGILLDKHGELLNGEPFSMPQSGDLPPEVPRMILKSADGDIEVRCSGARLDILWRATSDDRDLDLKAHQELVTRLASDYIAATHATVARLAIVLRRIAELEDAPRCLAAHFCKDRWLSGPLNRPSGFEIHAHKVFRLAGKLDVNSWFRVRSAHSTPEKKPLVLVEEDFNTLAEEMDTREFRESDIQEFLAISQPELDYVLKLYFPADAND
jgi:hypothetical protein